MLHPMVSTVDDLAQTPPLALCAYRGVRGNGYTSPHYPFPCVRKSLRPIFNLLRPDSRGVTGPGLPDPVKPIAGALKAGKDGRSAPRGSDRLMPAPNHLGTRIPASEHAVMLEVLGTCRAVELRVYQHTDDGAGAGRPDLFLLPSRRAVQKFCSRFHSRLFLGWVRPQAFPPPGHLREPGRAQRQRSKANRKDEIRAYGFMGCSSCAGLKTITPAPGRQRRVR